jgi:hypothetical protein
LSSSFQGLRLSALEEEGMKGDEERGGNQGMNGYKEEGGVNGRLNNWKEDDGKIAPHWTLKYSGQRNNFLNRKNPTD